MSILRRGPGRLPPPVPRTGAQPLLLAWLQATQQPGAPDPRLENTDRVWWLSQGHEDLVEPADALAEYARAGKWSAAAETAAQMLHRVGPVADVCWSADFEFRAASSVCAPAARTAGTPGSAPPAPGSTCATTIRPSPSGV